MVSKIKKITVKLPSNKNFGIVFFIVFLIISLYPLINNDTIRYWSLPIAFTFLILGIFNSNLLLPLNKLWTKFGLILGRIISPIVMGFIFFFIVMLTSLILKLFNKDVLNLKINKKTKSYWIQKDIHKSRMEKQF